MRRTLLLLSLALLSGPVIAEGPIDTYLQEADTSYGADRLAAVFGRFNYKTGESIQTKLAGVHDAALAAASGDAQRAAIETHWATLGRCSLEAMPKSKEKQQLYQARLQACKTQLATEAAAIKAAGSP